MYNRNPMNKATLLTGNFDFRRCPVVWRVYIAVRIIRGMITICATIISAPNRTLTVWVEADRARVWREVFSVIGKKDADFRNSDRHNCVWVCVIVCLDPLYGSSDHLISVISPFNVRRLRTVEVDTARDSHVVTSDNVAVDHLTLRLRHWHLTTNNTTGWFKIKHANTKITMS